MSGSEPPSREYGIISAVDSTNSRSKAGKVDADAVRQSASQGDPKAQMVLGRMYEEGDGVRCDEGAAFEWYRAAAEQGYPEAQLAVGSHYQIGQLVAKDDVRALAWYRKAADQGYPEGQCALGVAYYEGQIVPKDVAQAEAWFRRAADQGDAGAKSYLDSIAYLRGDSEQADRELVSHDDERPILCRPEQIFDDNDESSSAELPKSENEWLYLERGEKRGPVNTAGLVRLLLVDLPPDTRIWRQGFPAWVAASEVGEVASRMPPPLPPAVVVGTLLPSSGNAQINRNVSGGAGTRRSPAEEDGPTDTPRQLILDCIELTTSTLSAYVELHDRTSEAGTGMSVLKSLFGRKPDFGELRDAATAMDERWQNVQELVRRSLAATASRLNVPERAVFTTLIPYVDSVKRTTALLRDRQERLFENSQGRISTSYREQALIQTEYEASVEAYVRLGGPLNDAVSRLLAKEPGFRWSLYVVHEGGLMFAMHEHSVLRIAAYVMGYFAGGKTPVSPWELYLNFNARHQTTKLATAHFTPDGARFSRQLIQEIEAIDPGYKVGPGEPVFEEAATGKQLPVLGASNDLQYEIDNWDKPQELTFFRVMDRVFGKA